MNINNRILKEEKYFKFIILLLGFATVCGITLNLDMSTSTEPGIMKYLTSMGGFSMNKLILFAGICMLYYHAFLYLKKRSFSLQEKIWIVIPAFLFANFMVWGYSFEQTDSFNLVLGGKVQMLKSFTMAAAYFILFTFGIACLYAFSDQVNIRNKGNTAKNAYVRLFYKHPFLTPFLTMLICYIPYIILSYPAICMGDTRHMICQGYNLPSSSLKGIKLLDENVLMTGKHGVIYPVFLTMLLKFSKAVFDNFNYGIFIVAMCQLLAILAAVSCTLRYMVKQKVRFGILLFIMIYYIVTPRVQSYMFLITKDVFSGCCLLIFLVNIYRLLKDTEERSLKRCIWTWLSACGVGLIRNDGKIVLILSLVTMILFLGKRLRKRMILVTAASLMIVLGFTRVLMPALHISPVSSRAMFSIPFQQMARYLREYGDEVTEEEREAIDAVLSYDKLAELYNPNLSDPVKNTYKTDATSEDIKRYLKVWFQMFCKHPGVCIEATMNNYFYYVYPGKKPAAMYSYAYSISRMEKRINVDKQLATIDMYIRHPYALDEERELFEAFREKIFALPVLNIFRSSAMFVWVLLLIICYLLKNRKWSLLAVISPLFFTLLVCFASPCNGVYFRYLYGITLCLPIAAALVLMAKEENSAETGNTEQGIIQEGTDLL